MSDQGDWRERPAPRGGFDHPGVSKARHRVVDLPPGWDESEPSEKRRPDAEPGEATPPREAGDVPRKPLADRVRERGDDPAAA